MKDEFRQNALEYHKFPIPGKFVITPTKPMSTQSDLALAYSPGVAAPCEEIARDPMTAREYTNRGNLVAVITNGTAVLGLGNIGPLASKPVMEGKAVLFKKFAGIDVFDIEIQEEDPKKLIDIIASLAPTFGAINLEDIKAPQCFEVEQALKERLDIPVFHDDQHGTAIIASAALINGLKLVKKEIGEVKLVTSGAGAAALACLDMMVELGLKRENIWVTDQAGIVYEGRPEKMDDWKSKYAQKTNQRTLHEALKDADVFLGLSAGGVLKPEMLKDMARDPLIFALANPEPEILPDVAKAVRPDAIMATGRTDYPNQVNNALCFPYIFRGALDVGAQQINDAMKKACVYALADLAMIETSDVVSSAYGGQNYSFGPEYLIPKPFDPRLVIYLSEAVARAAMETGVATRPIEDFQVYRQRLSEIVFKSGLALRQVFSSAKKDPKRVVYTEGEDITVLRAVQNVVDEGIAHPILIGRPEVIQSRIEKQGLRIREGVDFTVTNPNNDPRFREYWTLYHSIMERRGITPDIAKQLVRTNGGIIGSLMVKRKEADAVLCGPKLGFSRYLGIIQDVIGLQLGIEKPATLSPLIIDNAVYFFTDAYVNPDPTAFEVAQIAMMAARQVEKFGMTPRVALLSHSNFGASAHPSAVKMAEATQIIKTQMPDLEIEGEMHGETALDPLLRSALFPNSALKGQTNLFVMPSMDSAHIAMSLCKTLAKGLSIGPLLLGSSCPAHILSSSATVRGIVNMTSLAVVDAQVQGCLSSESFNSQIMNMRG